MTPPRFAAQVCKINGKESSAFAFFAVHAYFTPPLGHECPTFFYLPLPFFPQVVFRLRYHRGASVPLGDVHDFRLRAAEQPSQAETASLSFGMHRMCHAAIHSQGNSSGKIVDIFLAVRQKLVKSLVAKFKK